MSTVFDHRWLGGMFADEEAALIWSPERQVAHMLAFEAAFTRALGHAGKIPSGVAETVATGIAAFEVDLDNLQRGTAKDGLPVPALVSQLRKMAGRDGAAVHTGATSQDVLDTALALTLREFSLLLQARLVDLIKAIMAVDQRFGMQPLVGRTRMQAALPITVEDRLRTWVEPLRTHLERLEQVRARVELLQLGGAVGDGASLAPQTSEIAAHMADELGLSAPNSSWHAMRDGIADYGNLLSLISGSLGKLGQDVCLMAQQGIDEIGLSGGGGSSAMPHKQNPVLAELLVTLARYNAVQLSGLHQALVHEQERSGAAWMLEWMILPDMAQTTARSLSAASELCAQIERIGSRDHQ